MPVHRDKLTREMSDFSTTWELSRGRFVESFQGLTQNQLNYRLYPGSLTIGEMAIHVFGVEVSFTTQLLDLELSEFENRVKLSATEGAVNDNPFPFSPEEITPELVAQSEALGKSFAEKIIYDASDEIRAKSLVSALGPVITGEGALARFSFHPGYHQGQVYLIRQSPDFPKQ